MTIDSREWLLTTRDVAGLFRVDRKTVARWARRGYIPSTRMPGGHLRFRRADVNEMLIQSGLGPAVSADVDQGGSGRG